MKSFLWSSPAPPPPPPSPTPSADLRRVVVSYLQKYVRKVLCPLANYKFIT